MSDEDTRSEHDAEEVKQEEEEEEDFAARQKRTFKKYSYRGVDLAVLLDMSTEQLIKLLPARPRRKFERGLPRKPMGLIKKLRKAVCLTALDRSCLLFL